MKKLVKFALILAIMSMLTIPAYAVTNVNQDFSNTGVEVTVTEPEVVYVGSDVSIVLDVTNNVDRGIPDVTIWINGEMVSNFDIPKGTTATYTLAVDTSEAGDQVFLIEIWSRINNKNFAQQLYEGTTVITVVEVEEEDILALLNDALNALLADGDPDWTGDIELAGYIFHSESNPNASGTKQATINGETYSLIRTGNAQNGYGYKIN
ncbi:MAG: hypothetical protein FWH40_10115 [Coriobacteriia bacterium]|nr:hypothetical protein [Coriobacteriia bacterium]